MRFDEDALRNLLKEEARPDRQGCPPADVLARAALGEASPQDRRAVVEHVADCRDCAEEMQLASPLPGPSAPRAAWAALAVAAAVVLAVGLPALLRRVAPSELRGTAGTREAAAPSDGARLAAPPGRLEWPAVPGAKHYVVTLYDSESTSIWESPRLETPSVRLPAEVLTRLKNGAYTWRVVAIGEFERTRSPLHRFAIER